MAKKKTDFFGTEETAEAATLELLNGTSEPEDRPQETANSIPRKRYIVPAEELRTASIAMLTRKTTKAALKVEAKRAGVTVNELINRILQTAADNRTTVTRSGRTLAPKSVRVQIKCTAALADRIYALAYENKTSVNDYVNQIIEQAIETEG